jgi:hypothetical protein
MRAAHSEACGHVVVLGNHLFQRPFEYWGLGSSIEKWIGFTSICAWITPIGYDRQLASKSQRSTIDRA